MKKNKKNTGTVKSINFDKDNQNLMIVNFEDGSSNTMIVPPGYDRVDILTEEKLPSLYNFDFKGIVIMTYKDKRLVYLGIKLICEQWFSF